MRLTAFLKRGPVPLGLVILFLTHPASAFLDTKESRTSLKGIESLHVMVGSLPAEAEKAGLTRNQVQTDVELRLRKAGVRVDTSDSGVVLLYVNVAVQTNQNLPRLFAVAVSLLLVQPAYLERNFDYAVATTWQKGTFGFVGENIFRNTVRETVGDLVDAFINAYLEENPKQ